MAKKKTNNNCVCLIFGFRIYVRNSGTFEAIIFNLPIKKIPEKLKKKNVSIARSQENFVIWVIVKDFFEKENRICQIIFELNN